MGAAAWKKTSSGSMPNSLKKPFSTPMKSGADEVSLRAPILTFCSAPAGAVPATTAAAQAAKASAVIRRIEKPPLVTGVVLSRIMREDREGDVSQVRCDATAPPAARSERAPSGKAGREETAPRSPP